MKTQYSVPLVMLTGFGIGAMAIQSLHAEATIKAAGDCFLAAGQEVNAIEGDPPSVEETP
jgi:hypothetical protein